MSASPESDRYDGDATALSPLPGGWRLSIGADGENRSIYKDFVAYDKFARLRAELDAAREAIRWLYLLCQHYEQGVVAATGDPRGDGKVVIYGKDITGAVRAALEEGGK